LSRILPARGSGAAMGADQVGLARLLVSAREASLGLFLPAAARCLLPIDDRVACRLVGLPARARFDDRGLVAAVEQLEAALVVGHTFRSCMVGDEQEAGAVWILVDRRQPYRIAG